MCDASLIQDGHIEVPTEPGLEIELDEDAVDKHLLDGESGFE